jgi:hypothetical protein
MLNTVGLLSITFNFIYLPRYLIRVSLILDYFLQWYDLKYRTLQEYPTTIRQLLNIDKKNPTCHFITVSEWVLYNAKWAIFHLYHGENKLYFWWDEDDLSFYLNQRAQYDFLCPTDTTVRWKTGVDTYMIFLRQIVRSTSVLFFLIYYTKLLICY